MTQISETALYAAATTAHDGASEHPAGRIALGSGGALGLRSRLLSASDGDAGYGGELPPLTTFTSPL
ncbi:hypothetical protein OG909_09730 [Streptomyces sp. NBC_01754]|uniref:hypothetical protein n=1 Tax=Streptomyces sp. NBC_01754 TaxID=2975930 RepID=UPI002DDBD7C6|nr:hypothetical protein [Streptomyces sp. NBC_01754]WSC92552.1 hypothetical protein OG909_09730 [Streptomyces sp. NBC_01754]